MPTVPSYGNRKVEQAPLPGARQSGPGGAVETPQSEGAAIGGALQDLGTTGVRLGLQFGEVQHQHQEEASHRRQQLFELNATRRANESLERALMDPDHGVLTARGIDVMPRAQSARAQWDNDMGTIANDAQNDDERLIAEHIKVNYTARLHDAIDRHQDTELRKYDTAEKDGLVASAERTILAAATTSPATAVLTLHNTEDQIRKYAARNSLGPKETADMVADTNNRLASAAVLEVLQKGNPALARALMDQFIPSAHAPEGQTPDPSKDILTGAARLKLEEALDVATTATTGLQAADTIWQQHGPKNNDDPNDPIRIADMEAAARATFANDPKTLAATIGYLRERKAGVDAQRKDVAEATASTIYKAIANGAGLAQVTKMPEFAQLSGPQQTVVTEHILDRAERAANRLYTLSGHAFEQAQRARAQTEQSQQALYYQLSNPAVLTGMSENAIQAKRGDLGDEMTNKLLEAKAKLTSPAAVRAATINDVLADEIARRAHQNVDVPASKQSIADLAQVGRLKDAVLSAISDAESGGRELTYEQKKAIGFQIVDRTVFLDAHERTAATVVNPHDQARAYVPIDRINKTNVTEWANLIRTHVPGAQAFRTTEEVVARYKDRIQRAHAAIMMGLGDEEALRRLTTGPSNAPAGPYPENLSIGP